MLQFSANEICDGGTPGSFHRSGYFVFRLRFLLRSINGNQSRAGIGRVGQKIQGISTQLAGEINLSEIAQQRLLVVFTEVGQNGGPEIRKLDPLSGKFGEPAALGGEEPLKQTVLLVW